MSFLDHMVPGFMMEWWFLYILGPGVLIALIITYFVLRNKRSEDDD